MKKLITMLIAVFLWVVSSWAQTTLISPTGDGGFENGTTFAANGWTESNSVNNPWVVGTYVSTPPFVNRSAYVSNDGGATNNYTNSLAALNYIYRDVFVPAGETAMTLTFNWVCNGESSWDMIQIFVGPTSIIPIGTTTYPGSGLSNVPSGIAGATFICSLQLTTTIQSATFYLPGSFAGTTMRFIIAWKDDTSGGTAPGGSIDNISLVSQAPIPMTGVYTIDPAGSGSSNFTTFAAAISSLNLNGVGTGGVTFNVADGATFNETGLVIAATGTAANPIVFQKSGAGTRPVINFTGGSGTTDYGFELSGSDYITFNGLDIRDAGTSSSNYLEYGFYFLGAATNGCQNNTVKNCIIDLTKANTSSRGVYTSSAATAASGANSLNKFYNNTIQDAYNGYYFVGSSTVFDDNNEVNTQSGGISLIDNLGNNVATTLYGIYINYQTNLTIANTTLSNVTGSSSIYGIYDGSGATNTLNFFSNEIKNFTGSSTSSTVYAMYIGVGATNNIYSNLIHTISAPYTLYGLYIGGGTTNNVYKNSIYDINYSGTSTLIAYGLAIAGGTTNNVYNNFIYDIRAAAGTTGNPSVRAMNLSGGTTDNVYYNTVYLNYTSTSSTNQSAALYATTTPTLIDLRDNIFINKTDVTTGAYAVAFYQASAYLTNLSTNINNNLYYAGTPGAKNLIHYDVTNSDQTLAAYKGRVSPRDASAVTENPPFISGVSPFNLHLQTTIATQCESGGVAISSPIVVNTDYDGDARNATKPDIGADEFAGIPLDLTPPNISYAPLANTSSLNARTLTTTITDATGVPTAGIGLPVLYWKINSGSYSPVTGTYVSGNTYTFTFGAGVVLGNVVSYYIVAQDIASTPNVGSNPLAGASGFTYNPPAVSTPPTTPYSYTIVGALSGVYPVGAGQVYTTLTAAIADLNVKEVIAPVTFELWDATYSTSETFPLIIYQYAGGSPTNTVTFMPKTGVSPTITGSSASGILVLYGVDYVTLNGSNSGGNDKSMTWENINTAANTYTIGVFNNAGDPASNCTIKNCNVKASSQVSNATYAIILNAAGGGYNNIVIDNNNIFSARQGIQFAGVSGAPATNGRVTNNIIGTTTDATGIQYRGIILSYADNTLISGNEIMGAPLGNTNTYQAGIYIIAGSTNSVIRNNKIHDFYYTGTSGYGCYGIYYAAEATTPTMIYNNLIYGIKSDGDPGSQNYDPAGIYVYAGGNVKIYYNSINMYGATLSASYTTSYSSCISIYSGITALDIMDNILKNSMTTASGTGSNTAYSIYCASANTAFANINYNDYYPDGINAKIGYLGAAQTTLANWQTATAQDANSQNINPIFVSTTDLHFTNAALDNLGFYLPSVPYDYSGVSRTNPSDMGAYEFGTNPSVITLAATGVDCAGATLNGSINANGLTVNSYFDYGATTDYGSSIAAVPASVTGTTTTPISVFISIPPSTTLHFRARGVTSAGVTSYGTDMTLTTTATGAPLAITLPASTITDNSAILNGTVNALCNSTTVTFDYGLNTSYGSSITADQSPVTGSSVVPVTASLTGLTLNTLYHYRIVATSTQGTTYGADQSFTTGANPPIVTTDAATNIGNFAARLNGTVVASNQNTTVTFEYGLNTSYGSIIAGIPPIVPGNTPVAVYADVSALNYNTTYHYRCVGVNPAGTAYGTDQVFTTLCPIPEGAGTITGPTSVCQATTGNVYTVPAINYAYNGYVWTVPTGGTITAGAGTNSITVSYSSSATSGNVTVFGTSICGNGVPSSLAVTINPLPVPTITGPTVACITSTYTYSTQTGMSGYVWTVSAGGQIMSGAGTNTVHIKWNNTGSQSVTVTYISQFGCPAAAPTTVNVSIGNLPSPTIAGSNRMCANSGLYVYTTETGFFNYVWTVSNGGTIATGQGTYQVEINWTNPGNRSVSVNYDNSYGCDAADPTTFEVTVMRHPGPTGPIDGTHELCAGTSSVNYSIEPIPNTDNYFWTLPEGATIVEGEFTYSILVDFAQNAVSGDITVYGENLCGAGPTSDPFEVTVNPIPETPVVTSDGDYLLHSSAPDGNQWYYEGAEIPGAVDQDYQATEEGFFWTIVTLNGCVSAESNHEQVIFVGLNDPKAGNFAIYPIPSDGKFTITAVIAGEETFTIDVYNNLGVNVFEKKDFYVNGKAQQVIDLVNPSRGIYTVVLTGDNHSVIRKVIVN
jgi:trimeric autotransporter adhesin